MLVFYIYLFILLIMLIFTYNGSELTIRFSPLKIKILSLIAMVMILLKVTALLIMFFSQNGIFLYLLKPFAFLNFLYIPIVIAVCLYIFIRNDKINFSYCFVLSSFFAVIYLLIVYRIPAVVQSLPYYGYTMVFLDNLYVRYVFIAINTITLVFCISVLGKPIVNNLGVFLVLISSVLCIADMLLAMLGFDYLNQNIIGELSFVVTLNYAVSRFKNK